MNIFQSNKNYKGHHIIVKEAVQQEDTILNEHALKIDLQNALENTTGNKLGNTQINIYS